MSAGSKDGAWLNDATKAAGIDALGNIHVLNTDLTGTLEVIATLSAGSIDIGKVDQGLTGTIANSWFVTLTDGVNVLGSAAHPFRIDPTGTTTQPVSGTGNFTVTQATGTNLHTVVDSGSITVLNASIPVTQSGAWTTGRTWTLLNTTDSVNIGNFPATQPISGTVTVVQPTGTNLHVVNDASSAVIGHVITDTGSTTAVTGNVTVVQATGTNLHTVLDSGTLTTITNPVTVIQPTGANLNVTVSNFPAGGSNVSVVGPVSVSNFPIFQPVQPVDSTLLPINPAKEDGNLSSIAQEIVRVRRLAEETKINQMLLDLQLIVLNERYSSTNDYEVR